MRYAIFSDIHGNLGALQAIIDDINERRKTSAIDQVVCLGDMVGYGCYPHECLELIREFTDHIIKGNHDDYISNDHALRIVKTTARESILLSRELLSDEEKTFLKNLPLTYSNDSFHCAHSNIMIPENFEIYLINTDVVEDNFHIMSKPILFVGHLHIPMHIPMSTTLHIIERDGHNCVLTRQKYRMVFRKGKVGLRYGDKYIINVGAVGQPRDRDKRPSYVIYDSEEMSCELIRVEYDVGQAVNALLNFNHQNRHFPIYNALRLHVGV